MNRELRIEKHNAAKPGEFHGVSSDVMDGKACYRCGERYVVFERGENYHGCECEKCDTELKLSGDACPKCSCGYLKTRGEKITSCQYCDAEQFNAMLAKISSRKIWSKEKLEWIENITEINVPNHMSNPTDLTPNPNPVGRCEIFIVSYWKDFPWLELCLRSIAKYCKGFAGVTVAIPERDKLAFDELCSFPWVKVKTYDEVEGKGMVQHMEIMARADEFVPHGTEYVLHHDSDGIFNVPTTPEDFFRHDKPVYLYRTWESLTGHDGVVSDCAQWREPTDAQLGFQSEIYAMCVNTQMMPIWFYQHYRHCLESVHGDIHEYFIAGKNSFPQDRQDFTTMGAFAYKRWHGAFAWFDVENGSPHPRDPKRSFWSHGGILPEIRAEIEKILA